jgi:DNA-binding response OmpR family regulator
MNILIIEDEILIQKSLKKLIEMKGHTVDAIALILENNYDRIICDLMLQDITGFDIIEESKQKYDIDQIAKDFIIMTAYSSEQVLTKARSYGCRVVNKPFDNINQTIDEILL